MQSDILKLTQQFMAIQRELKSLKSVSEKQEVNTSCSINTSGNLEGSSIQSGRPSLVDSGSEHSLI